MSDFKPDSDHVISRERDFELTGAVVTSLLLHLDDLVEPYGDLHGLATETLETVLSLYHDIFVSESARIAYLQMPRDFSEQLWLNPTNLEQIRSLVGVLEDYLRRKQDPGQVNSVLYSLEATLGATLSAAKRSKHDYLAPSQRLAVSKLVDSAFGQMQALKTRRSLSELNKKAEDAVADAEASATVATSAAHATKAAAGITSDVKMSSFYLGLGIQRVHRRTRSVG